MNAIEGSQTALNTAPDVLKEARDWLADCGMRNAQFLNSSAVVRVVHATYAGGWEQFIADTAALICEVTS